MVRFAAGLTRSGQSRFGPPRSAGIAAAGPCLAAGPGQPGDWARAHVYDSLSLKFYNVPLPDLSGAGLADESIKIFRSRGRAVQVQQQAAEVQLVAVQLADELVHG